MLPKITKLITTVQMLSCRSLLNRDEFVFRLRLWSYDHNAGSHVKITEV